MQVESKKSYKGLLLMLCVAVCACLFFAKSVNEKNTLPDTLPGIEVAMAKTSLPAMTMITLKHFVKEMVSNEDLPKGGLISPARVIGRVLSRPVVEGQILTESCFVQAGSGAQLAAALPHGMRAVTVSLSNKTTPDIALLYPGCVVDVLVSFKLSSRNSEGQALSTTMLRGIQVLAVEGESVLSNPEQNTKEGTVAKTRRTSRGGATMVTLMLDHRQAEALSLAIKNGSISLTIRNPLDRNLIGLEATILSQGKLIHSGSALTPVVPSIDEESLKLFLEKARGNRYSEPNDTNIPTPKPKLPEEHQTRKSPRWRVTVIRGSTIQEVHSDLFSSIPSRQQLGLSTLSMNDENGDKWILDVIKRQSVFLLRDSSPKPGPPLLIKTDVQISGRDVSIGLIVKGQAGEQYFAGASKNGRVQPPPSFKIVDEAGKILATGTFKYG